MALLPRESKHGKEGDRGIFGQWLHYTQALVGRVVELEREIALMRELLGSEYSSSHISGQSTAGKKGARSLIFPQDRYVLGGLSEVMWERLNKELDVTAEMVTARIIELAKCCGPEDGAGRIWLIILERTVGERIL